MRIAEHFYSIQGEGITMGVPAVFLRLSGCNLLCGGQGTIEDKQLHNGATWRCDTIEVWAKQGLKQTPEEIIKLFDASGYLEHIRNGAHLVITGGEPLQQHEEILTLIRLLQDATAGHPYIEIETNGTLMPSIGLQEHVDQWNVSPKLSNSGMPYERRIEVDVLELFGGMSNAWCKLVVSSEEDLKEVKSDEFGVSPAYFFPRNRTILMPAASDRATLQKLLPIVAEFCKQERYRLSTRMQVEIWDKTTGV